MKKQYPLWIISRVLKGRRLFFQDGGAYGELWKVEPYEAKLFVNEQDARSQVASLEKLWVPYYTKLHAETPIFEIFQVEMKLNKR